MIVGYHVIFSTYGFWLPNDPRGSWSTFVGSWDLYQHGPATKTSEKRSVAHRQHDRTQRLAAKQSLKYPAVQFNGFQARAVARGFSSYFNRAQLPVWACAILPDHVHLVVARPAIKVEHLVARLKSEATLQLIREGIHPMTRYQQASQQMPKCWVRGQWKVFLEPQDVCRAIEYVDANPVKEGKKKQTWSFVVPYSNSCE